MEAVAWRILLTAAYGVAFGAVLALHNHGTGGGDAVTAVVWALAPVVGFLVGRWWVALAFLGALVGHAIGWDPASNDGDPAFWPPFLVMFALLVGGPLALGAALRGAFGTG